MAETKIGAIVAELKLNSSKFSRGIVKAEKTMGKFQKTIKRIGTSLASLAAIGGIGLLGKKLISAARDAEESENLFRESFRGMSAEARKWSEETSKALGLNQFELRESSALIFNMTRSMGLAKDEAFAMATGMTELAQDMASFFNLRPDDAFNKLRAGITGEAEPLKRLGILVDEATIKQAAYSKGIATTGAVLTQTQKVQARWLAILDQTTTAQGDLGRTLGSTSNQMRSIQARTDELAISTGKLLIPVFNRLLNVISDLVDTLKPFFDELNKIDEINRRLAKSTLDNRFGKLSEETDDLRSKLERLQTSLSKTGGILFGREGVEADLKEQIRLTKELISAKELELKKIIEIRNRNLKLGLVPKKPGPKPDIDIPVPVAPPKALKKAFDQQVKDFKAHQKRIAEIQGEILNDSTSAAQKEFEIFDEALKKLTRIREISAGDTLAIAPFTRLETEGKKALKAIELGLVNVEQQWGETNKEALKMEEVLKFFDDPLDDLARLQVAIEDVGKQMNFSSDQIAEALKRSEEGFDLSADAASDWEKQILDSVETIRSGLESNLTDSFQEMINGTENFRDAFINILKDIQREIIRVFIVKQLISAVGGALTGLFGGGGSLAGPAAAIGATQAVSSLSFAANGANAMRGQSFVVGEKGPEIFTAPNSGRIIPNDQIGGGVNVTLQVTTGVQSTVRAELVQLLPKIQETVKAGVADARLRGGQFSRAMGV